MRIAAGNIYLFSSKARIMNAKSISNTEDVIYSTYPEFEYEYENVKEPDTLHPQEQLLTIGLGKRKIDGALTTTITGFIGKRTELIVIEQELQSVCRTFGSSRMYDVILKGDVRKRAYVYLRNKGFGVQFAELA